MKKFLVGTTIVFAVAAVVHTQGALTGKWQGDTPSGDPIVLDITADDRTATGTIIIDGQTFALADGKVAKNTLTFKVSLGNRAEAFSGELAGDRLTIWIDRQGRDRSGAILMRLRP